jgi:hypothetical protein
MSDNTRIEMQAQILTAIQEAADEELEACCNYILQSKSCGTKSQREYLVYQLKMNRRPLTLKERAIRILSKLNYSDNNNASALIYRSQAQTLFEAIALIPD